MSPFQNKCRDFSYIQFFSITHGQSRNLEFSVFMATTAILKISRGKINPLFMFPWQLQHYSDLIICQTYATWSKYYFYEDCWWKSIHQFLCFDCVCIYLSIWLFTMTTNRHFENSKTKLYLYIRESTIP